MKYTSVFLLLIMVLLVAGSGCTDTAARVKNGDTVKVHYTGTFDNGTVFDSSAGREPLEFSVGAGMMIRGFDEGVVGMQEGETKTLHIPADRAYGHYREDLLFLVDPIQDILSGGPRQGNPPRRCPGYGVNLTSKKPTPAAGWQQNSPGCVASA